MEGHWSDKSTMYFEKCFEVSGGTGWGSRLAQTSLGRKELKIPSGFSENLVLGPFFWKNYESGPPLSGKPGSAIVSKCIYIYIRYNFVAYFWHILPDPIFW